MTFDPERFCTAIRATIDQKRRDLAPDHMAGDPVVPFILSEIKILETIVAAVRQGTACEQPALAFKVDAAERARLREAVNSDVKDDGARIILHRLINATDAQRVPGGEAGGSTGFAGVNVLLSAMDLGAGKHQQWMPNFPIIPTVPGGVRTRDEWAAVRGIAVEAARETLRAKDGTIHGDNDWRSAARDLAETILAIFGEEK